MNDFTKDELEEILDLLIRGFSLHELKHISVFNKIQSLIDNYCKHYFEYACVAVNKCRDCGIVKNENINSL